ncbi:MAG: SDR family oxidoreductase [Bdellovibrionales bacterium]|nr:SDR family oxidoreductase [Oligoflexia bacterium]
MDLPLKDKFALVTGASGTIGSAIAKRLAEEGASVLVHFHASHEEADNVVQIIRSKGGLAELVSADLAERNGPSNLIDQLDLAFNGRFAGRLDILVNNAGTLAMDSIVDTTDESFDRLFNVNVRALFQLSREAARRMSKQNWGRIINIGSVFGQAAYFPGLSTYSGTKFAVQGLTRGWSRDLGEMGITVNNIQPAVIQADPAPDSGAIVDAMKTYTSIKRFGKPEEVAEAVAFLVSTKSGFINGANLNVDGGWGS